MVYNHTLCFCFYLVWCVGKKNKQQEQLVALGSSCSALLLGMWPSVADSQRRLRSCSLGCEVPIHFYGHQVGVMAI